MKTWVRNELMFLNDEKITTRILRPSSYFGHPLKPLNNRILIAAWRTLPTTSNQNQSMNVWNNRSIMKAVASFYLRVLTVSSIL